MGTIDRPLTRRLLAAYIAVILVIMYIPMLVVGLASISKSRFFLFPMRRTSSKWYEMTWDSLQIHESFLTSLTVAVCVALISVILAFFGALAYARYDWRGRRLFQQVLLIPVFFPQAVLGLALQLWFNSMGIQMSWQSTVFAQLVWIVPIVTLVVAIQAYGYDSAVEEAAYDLGASRWQIFRTITLPLLGPGIFAGFLFAVLLLLGQLPTRLLHQRRRRHRARMALRQDDRRLHADGAGSRAHHGRAGRHHSGGGPHHQRDASAPRLIANSATASVFKVTPSPGP